MLWDGGIGKDLVALKRLGGSSAVFSVAFSPDGQRIAAGSADHTLGVWEAATAQQVGSWQKEEEAEERIAVLRGEQAAAAQHEQAVRAQDPGAIKQWLVLAPIRFEG